MALQILTILATLFYFCASKKLTLRSTHERCWPAPTTDDKTEGPQHQLQAVASGSITFARCITHSLDHEWNYYHLFERNLFGIFTALRENRGGNYMPPTHKRATGTRDIGVILEDQTNTNLLRPWMNAIVGADFVTLNSPSRPEVCCDSVDTSSSHYASFGDVIPHLRDFMYQEAGMSLLQQTDARKKLCFLNRKTPGRGRSFINQGELTQAAESLSYETEFLTFEGKSPTEQVQMVSDCDVAIGIHGAGLTNFMWMRPGAVAIQVLPYQSSSGLLHTLEMIANGAGLKYREWEPTSYKQVQVHWEQMKDHNNILEQVCACGVRVILEYGTNGRCRQGGVDKDFLNWAFYVNQDVEVPVDDFKKLLEPAVPASPDPLGGASFSEVSVSLQTMAAVQPQAAASAETGSDLWALNEAMAQQMAQYKAEADDVIERLTNMPVEQAEALCTKMHN